jgi:hypothetical protein
MFCKTCRHWGHYRDGHCDAVDGERGPSSFEIDVRVLDDTDLWTGLKTGPDFGCVHWTDKKKKKHTAASFV